eukprot:COSAG02_NODE_2826_length_7942_cov_6.674869_6_plen_40_part_00
MPDEIPLAEKIKGSFAEIEAIPSNALDTMVQVLETTASI